MSINPRIIIDIMSLRMKLDILITMDVVAIARDVLESNLKSLVVHGEIISISYCILHLLLGEMDFIREVITRWNVLRPREVGCIMYPTDSIALMRRRDIHRIGTIQRTVSIYYYIMMKNVPEGSA